MYRVAYDCEIYFHHFLLLTYSFRIRLTLFSLVCFVLKVLPSSLMFEFRNFRLLLGVGVVVCIRFIGEVLVSCNLQTNDRPAKYTHRCFQQNTTHTLPCMCVTEKRGKIEISTNRLDLVLCRYLLWTVVKYRSTRKFNVFCGKTSRKQIK